MEEITVPGVCFCIKRERFVSFCSFARFFWCVCATRPQRYQVLKIYVFGGKDFRPHSLSATQLRRTLYVSMYTYLYLTCGPVVPHVPYCIMHYVHVLVLVLSVVRYTKVPVYSHTSITYHIHIYIHNKMKLSIQ